MRTSSVKMVHLKTADVDLTPITEPSLLTRSAWLSHAIYQAALLQTNLFLVLYHWNGQQILQHVIVPLLEDILIKSCEAMHISNSFVQHNRQTQGHTCHLNFKDKLLISSFTGIFSSILLLHIIQHQLTALALWLHVDSLTGAQLLAILEPFHLSLEVRNFTAQSGFLGGWNHYFFLIRVLVGEGSLNFWSRNQDLGI